MKKMTGINYGDEFNVENEYYIGGLLAAICGVHINPNKDDTIEYIDWNEGYENVLPVSNTVNMAVQ